MIRLNRWNRVAALVVVFHVSLAVAGDFNTYYNYISTYPSDDESMFSEECQGVTTDGEHWIFSRNQFMWLMKIPLLVDLATVSKTDADCYNGTATCLNISALPEFSDMNHIGDIDYYEYRDAGGTLWRLLLAPFEDIISIPRPTPLLGVFDANTLSYLGKAELPSQTNGYGSWVAADPDGFVYSGRGSKVYRYRIDWESFVTNNPLVINYEDEFDLKDENGNNYSEGPAGGVFSKDGLLLYISSDGGVDAFDMITKRRVRQLYGPVHENEGLTILDVEALPPHLKPPNVSGQLHAVMLRNDVLFNDDDIFFYHFSNRIYVDGGFVGTGLGRPSAPFQTVNQANAVAWDGAIFSITAGTYPESVVLTNQLKLEATGGAATIVGQ